ncbi:MAG: Hsp70 family protein [bacterium]
MPKENFENMTAEELANKTRNAMKDEVGGLKTDGSKSLLGANVSMDAHNPFQFDLRVGKDPHGREAQKIERNIKICKNKIEQLKAQLAITNDFNSVSVSDVDLKKESPVGMMNLKAELKTQEDFLVKLEERKAELEAFVKKVQEYVADSSELVGEASVEYVKKLNLEILEAAEKGDIQKAEDLKAELKKQAEEFSSERADYVNNKTNTKKFKEFMRNVFGII